MAVLDQATAAAARRAERNNPLKIAAGILNGLGRLGDTELVHVNPMEIAFLEALGGSGDINPMTGLREYNNKKGGSLESAGSGGGSDSGGGWWSGNDSRGRARFDGTSKARDMADRAKGRGPAKGHGHGKGGPAKGHGKGVGPAETGFFDDLGRIAQNLFDPLRDLFDDDDTLAYNRKDGSLVATTGRYANGERAPNHIQRAAIQSMLRGDYGPMTQAEYERVRQRHDYFDIGEDFGTKLGNTIAGAFGFHEIDPVGAPMAVTGETRATWGFDAPGLVGTALGPGLGLATDLASETLGRPGAIPIGPEVFSDAGTAAGTAGRARSDGGQRGVDRAPRAVGPTMATSLGPATPVATVDPSMPAPEPAPPSAEDHLAGLRDWLPGDEAARRDAIARVVAAAGDPWGDTQLVHASPQAQAALIAAGGSGRTNPLTGRPQFALSQQDERNMARDILGFQEDFGGGRYMDYINRENLHGKAERYKNLIRQARDQGYAGPVNKAESWLNQGGFANRSNLDRRGNDVGLYRDYYRRLGFEDDWGGGRALGWLEDQMARDGFTPKSTAHPEIEYWDWKEEQRRAQEWAAPEPEPDPEPAWAKDLAKSLEALTREAEPAGPKATPKPVNTISDLTPVRLPRFRSRRYRSNYAPNFWF